MASRRLILALAISIPALAHADNEYPTLDRVNYALDCMDRHGGQSIDNLVACSCEFDKVASKMSYEEFIDANMYVQHKDLPGDKGGLFRDAKFAEDRYDKMLELRAEAEKSCFIRERIVKRKSEEGTAAVKPERQTPAAESSPAPTTPASP